MLIQNISQQNVKPTRHPSTEHPTSKTSSSQNDLPYKTCFPQNVRVPKVLPTKQPQLQNVPLSSPTYTVYNIFIQYSKSNLCNNIPLSISFININIKFKFLKNSKSVKRPWFLPLFSFYTYTHIYNCARRAQQASSTCQCKCEESKMCVCIQ
jgi:hypothetical protein